MLNSCTMTGNSAFYGGGGVRCDSSSFPALTNCTIAGNSANERGGGFHCSNFSSPTLTNCTIVGNSAEERGGGILCSSYSSPTLTNCILFADQPQEIYISSGDPVVTYSNVQGGWEGEGNINANPRFVSRWGFDYLLKPHSPCVDAGDPALEDGLYDWHPRWPDWYPDGPRSDIGVTGGPGNGDWLR